MKTAVSIPDGIFARAEALAKRLGVSRSNLYAQAVSKFIEAQRSTGVTSALNGVYAASGSGLDPALAEIQRRSVESEDW